MAPDRYDLSDYQGPAEEMPPVYTATATWQDPHVYINPLAFFPGGWGSRDSFSIGDESDPYITIIHRQEPQMNLGWVGIRRGESFVINCYSNSKELATAMVYDGAVKPSRDRGCEEPEWKGRWDYDPKLRGFFADVAVQSEKGHIPSAFVEFFDED